MANAHLAYADLAIDKFSGTDPDQDAESFIQLIERKKLCFWRRTWRFWWTGKLHFQEQSAVFFFAPKTSRWVVWE